MWEYFYYILSFYDGIHCDFTSNLLLNFYFNSKENSHKKTLLNYHYFGDYRKGTGSISSEQANSVWGPQNYPTKNCWESAITTLVTPNPKADLHMEANVKDLHYPRDLGSILPFNILGFEWLKSLSIRFQGTLKPGESNWNQGLEVCSLTQSPGFRPPRYNSEPRGLSVAYSGEQWRKLIRLLTFYVQNLFRQFANQDCLFAPLGWGTSDVPKITKCAACSNSWGEGGSRFRVSLHINTVFCIHY